jgi:general secretion pathway protein G
MNRYSSLSRKRSGAARRAGFTLIEVLLVLVILVILGSIAVPMFTGTAEKANQQAAQVQVNAFETAIDLYHIGMRQYPASLDDLINAPSDAKQAKRWSGPYLKENRSLVDPWDNPYKYNAKGTKNPGRYDVWSYGPDGQSGTDDDIGNWGDNS